MFTATRKRRRGVALLAALVIATLVLPYGRAATCECHDHVAEHEHCPTTSGPALTTAGMDYHCDAMMACCLIDFGPVLNSSAVESEGAYYDLTNSTLLTTLTQVSQAPPKPPPRV